MISLYPAPVKIRLLLLLLSPQRKAINVLLKTLSTVLPLHHRGMATRLMANGRPLQSKCITNNPKYSDIELKI